MWGGEGRGPVSISFTYTEDEYVRAARLFYARAYRTRFNLWFGALLALLGAAGLVLEGEVAVLSTVCLLMGAVLLSFGYVGHYVTPRRVYEANPKFRELYELDFTEEGIRFRSKGADTRLEWGFYSKVWETEEFYLLVYGKDMFSVIPKRAFREPLQEESFRALLRAKLGAPTKPGELKEARPAEAEYRPPAQPPDWR